MAGIRGGSDVFVGWIGGHGPRRVPVYRRKRCVLKWDLDHGLAMRGRPSGKILKIIAELQAEGRL